MSCCIKMQQLIFYMVQYNGKSAQMRAKVKSLVHLFKGGRGQGGGASLSLLASSEICLQTVQIIKVIADKL